MSCRLGFARAVREASASGGDYWRIYMGSDSARIRLRLQMAREARIDAERMSEAEHGQGGYRRSVQLGIFGR